MSKDPIPKNNLNNKNFDDTGIIIKSNGACHGISYLDQSIQNDPCWRYIYGTLDCPYISTMMYDFDINGPSEKNPFPL